MTHLFEMFTKNQLDEIQPAAKNLRQQWKTWSVLFILLILKSWPIIHKNGESWIFICRWWEGRSSLPN